MGKKKGGKKKLTEEELAAIEAHNKKYRDLGEVFRNWIATGLVATAPDLRCLDRYGTA